MIDYRIRSNGGFTEKMGELVCMLEHTRAVTLEEIKELKQWDLDFRVDESSNSIGALLHHIASIEFVHGIISFHGRDLNDVELNKWRTALELGEQARKTIQKQPIEYYINQLSEVRKSTLSQLQKLNDDWLAEENKWGNGVPYNNYYLWFHVMEDEINHRGQIRTIKRQLMDKKQN
ncbi:DinB family protein [Rossellomorea vietnamensis]|uniref:DinB family protein n=1 Tax=Rossellomorea vietnamensis TaxID=218284 RepID=A0A5D4NXP2_9BACI|nr:DinB family protein [Rossellomorea vietnamensis]TYS18551.1 DinB family protein [Rossellomorea vietnamensis]